MSTKSTLKVRRGEVYYCLLSDKGKSVQSHARPVVIVQNNYGNLYSGTVIIAPVTSRNKPCQPTHVSIDLNGRKTVLLEQIMTVDKSQLTKKLGYLDGKTMNMIDHALVVSLGL